jgi:hypothetical protein
MQKRRVTVTVDPELLDEASAGVSAGQAESISGWVAGAMELRAKRDRRLLALEALIAGYEADHGVITDDELADQERADRDAAALVRR